MEEFEDCHFIPIYILRHCSLLMEDNDIFILFYHISYTKHFICPVSLQSNKLCRIGLMVSVSASHTAGRGFAFRPGHTKDHHKNVTNCNALGLEFGSAARLSKRSGSVWNCLLGHTLKISPGINRKSRISHPGTGGFLSSATWPLLPKKHYNGLINQSIKQGKFICRHL